MFGKIMVSNNVAYNYIPNNISVNFMKLLLSIIKRIKIKMTKAIFIL